MRLPRITIQMFATIAGDQTQTASQKIQDILASSLSTTRLTLIEPAGGKQRVPSVPRAPNRPSSAFRALLTGRSLLDRIPIRSA